VKIIVKTPNFIGDTIMMLPALYMLKKHYKNATFTIVCKPNFETIFREMKIEKFIIDDTKDGSRVSKSKTLIKNLRSESYELGILFHNSFASALIFKLSKIKTIIGYKNDGRNFLLDYSIKINRSRHYINHYSTLVNKYLNEPFEKLPIININGKKQTFFTKNKPTIGLLLGSSKDTRSYPKDLSLELCKLLNYTQYQYIFLGDNLDIKNNNYYATYIKNSLNLTGKTDLSTFIDLISDLDLLVTIDTSAMHIASSTKTNFIVLLGQGTSPFSIVKPKVNFGTYLFKGQECIKDEDIIKKISPKTIVDEIEKRLKVD